MFKLVQVLTTALLLMLSALAFAGAAEDANAAVVAACAA